MRNLWRPLWPPGRSVQYEEVEQQSEALADEFPENGPIIRWSKKDLVGVLGIVSFVCVAITTIYTVRLKASQRALLPPEDFFPRCENERKRRSFLSLIWCCAVSLIPSSFLDEDDFLDEGPAGDAAWNNMMPGVLRALLIASLQILITRHLAV